MLLSGLGTESTQGPGPLGTFTAGAMPPPDDRASASVAPPPRLRALLAAAGLGCDAVLMLHPADATAPAARLVTALAQAHAATHDGHALVGHAGVVLALAPASALAGLAADVRHLQADIDVRLFRLPADATALLQAAGRFFTPPSVSPAQGSPRQSGAIPSRTRRAAPQREPFARIERGAAPQLVGWRLRASPDTVLWNLGAGLDIDGGSAAFVASMPAHPPQWVDLVIGADPPPDFRGTAITPVAMLAEAARLAQWRADLDASGGRLGVGPLDAATLRWLRPGAIPAHLLLLQWSEALPGLLVDTVADIAARSILVGADVPAALAWGLRSGIALYAGRVVEALLAAQRLSVCPLASGCEAAGCASRAAATDPVGRAGCGNPDLLARWAP